MTLSQLVAKLIDLEIEHGHQEVELEVGGDGANHTSTDVFVYEYIDRVRVTSEAP